MWLDQVDTLNTWCYTLNNQRKLFKCFPFIKHDTFYNVLNTHNTRDLIMIRLCVHNCIYCLLVIYPFGFMFSLWLTMTRPLFVQVSNTRWQFAKWWPSPPGTPGRSPLSPCPQCSPPSPWHPETSALSMVTSSSLRPPPRQSSKTGVSKS